MTCHSKCWLPVFFVIFCVFTIVNYKIHNSVPRKPTPEETAIHQNSGLYAEVLHKMQNECTSISDKQNNTFYTCKDGTKVTVLEWVRGSDRGFVTRDFDKNGKLISIYGHPDDR